MYTTFSLTGSKDIGHRFGIRLIKQFSLSITEMFQVRAGMLLSHSSQVIHIYYFACFVVTSPIHENYRPPLIITNYGSDIRLK